LRIKIPLFHIKENYLIPMAEPRKKIAWPCIEIRDNQVGMTWVECDDQGNEKDKVRLSWDDVFELGVEDWMIRCIIEESEESGDEYYRSEASVFHGFVEYPDISFETYGISPEIAERLNSIGFEIITGQPTQFVGSDFSPADYYVEPVPANYYPEPVEQPDNPDMHLGRSVESLYCPDSHADFYARPLTYTNPHNGERSYFCSICKKKGRKNPWHRCILGHKERGHDEQAVLTAIAAVGDGHSVYEIAKYCTEFEGNWDKRKVLRICDKLSNLGKIKYEISTRNNRQVKLVYLNRATM